MEVGRSKSGQWSILMLQLRECEPVTLQTILSENG